MVTVCNKMCLRDRVVSFVIHNKTGECNLNINLMSNKLLTIRPETYHSFIVLYYGPHSYEGKKIIRRKTRIRNRIVLLIDAFSI